MCAPKPAKNFTSSSSWVKSKKQFNINNHLCKNTIRTQYRKRSAITWIKNFCPHFYLIFHCLRKVFPFLTRNLYQTFALFFSSACCWNSPTVVFHFLPWFSWPFQSHFHSDLMLSFFSSSSLSCFLNPILFFFPVSIWFGKLMASRHPRTSSKSS